MTVEPNESLTHFLTDVKSRIPEVRAKAARDLRLHVERESRDVPAEVFNRYMNDLNKRIFDLVNSSEVAEKMGGIIVIDELIDVAYEENETKFTRFANYIRMVFQQSNDHSDGSLLKMASKALGHLARAGGTLAADIVEFEVKRALEWLEGDRSEQRRLAAVLVLKELAFNTPALFNVYVDTFLERIWETIRDPKTNIRIAAVEALTCCLVLIEKRVQRTRSQKYYKIFDEVQQTFKLSKPDGIHGALLVVGELLEMTGGFMLARFKEVCETVVQYKDDRDKLVRDTVVSLLPKLAMFEPEAFVRGYLNTCLTHLIGTVKTGSSNRAIALIALGELSLAVKENIEPQLTTILQLIREALVVKRGKPANSDTSIAALKCVSMLVCALGEKLVVGDTGSMGKLITVMFTCGLSKPLVDALSDLSTNIPVLIKDIQLKLLTTIEHILTFNLGTDAGYSSFVSDISRKPVERSGRSSVSSAFSYFSRPSAPPTPTTGKGSDGMDQLGLICLSLETLGTFDFGGHDLIQLVRAMVLGYLDHENAGVRMRAATTCSNLLLADKKEQMDEDVEDPYDSELSDFDEETVLFIVKQLLTVSVADPAPQNRQSVLESLGPRFDPFLVQGGNMNVLFVALNDEVFAIREAAIRVLGRLAVRNPVFAMPFLRKMLVQLLTELEYGGDSMHREESCILLSHLTESSEGLVRPYVRSILNVLIPKLDESDAKVSSCVLSTIGVLSRIAGEEMQQHLHTLLPIIVKILQDKRSPFKRQVALQALLELIKCTGEVIQPYLDYPELLPAILASIKGNSAPMRKEAIRVLGVLGSLDPYVFKKLDNDQDDEQDEDAPAAFVGGVQGVGGEEQAGKVELKDDMLSLSHTSEEYFPSVAITALMRILQDKGLSQHHNKVIQATMFILKSLGTKCIPFLPQILPHFLAVMRLGDGMMESMFTQLGMLVTIVKDKVIDYMDDIFDVIKDYLRVTENFTEQLLDLVQFVSIALRDDFKVYLPDILPHLLSILHSDRSFDRAPTLRVLHALHVFGHTTEEYLHLIIPALARLCEQLDAPPQLTEETVRTIGLLARETKMAPFASRLVHVLARMLATPDRHLSQAPSTPKQTHHHTNNVPGASTLRSVIIATICVLVYQLKSEFLIFVPVVAHALNQRSLSFPQYTNLVTKLSKGQPLTPTDLQAAIELMSNTSSRSRMTSAAVFSEEDQAEETKKLRVSQSNLKKAWEAQQRATKEDWQEWLRALSIELLKESPSPALRACSILAQKYQPLAGELFNAAFVSCWTELHDQYQDDLVRSLDFAFRSPTIPPGILQKLLNLAEFMEHDDKRLPIDSKTLGSLAEKCHAYAKALHYKEVEFHDSPDSAIESLISINIQLQLPDAAHGVLSYAKDNYKLELKESWFEKLQRWEDALEAYELKQVESPGNLQTSIGRMRCQSALGANQGCLNLVPSAWSLTLLDSPERAEIAPLAVRAAWMMGQWETMEKYLNEMEKMGNTQWEFAFYKAVFCIHQNQMTKATECIETARSLLDMRLAALIGESYNRAYRAICQVQELAELEEVIQYTTEEDPNVRARIRTMWTRRLKGCQRDVGVWNGLLSVRSLVVAPKEDIPTWLKFSSMCRKDDRLHLSKGVLTGLLGFDPQASKLLVSNSGEQFPADLALPTVIPGVSFAWLKHMFGVGAEAASLKGLSLLVKAMETSYTKTGEFIDDPHPFARKGHYAGLRILKPNQVQEIRAKMYVKLGKWQESVTGFLNPEIIPKVLKSFKLATLCDPKSYKVWHNWAVANFRVAQHYKQNAPGTERPSSNFMNNSPVLGGESGKGGPPQNVDLIDHVVCAINGFFRSIALAGDQSLQDILRLLTLWFSHGNVTSVENALRTGFSVTSIDTWLCVIPQVIARIDYLQGDLRRMIVELLSEIGKEHPQALVYPLTVASETNQHRGTRKANVADEVINRMKSHCSQLVEQAGIVSRELIRVAILWHEMWHEALEEASRLWFGQRNVDAMILTLAPLHKMMEEGPKTLREVAFMQNYGRDLEEGHEWTLRYEKTKNESDLNQAWDLYCTVYRKINKGLNSMTEIELQYVSPKLLEARNLELAVPGTYLDEKSIPNNPPVRIAEFVPSLQVIGSKQRPRKLQIIGSDGKEYAFLLKGHEDLRQDKRVMQLFGLVNTLLANHRDTAKTDLKIRGYSVIPLAPNSGLIQWMSACDTLHSLIKGYRDARNVLINIEHRLMQQMTNDYQNLTLIQKVEVFEHALSRTTGQDLAKVLWLKSENSEVWLDRRTNYVRSLATMSMVGYILGLGDRHPCNIMLDRHSGKIIHIDFGDCFEVAMQREKFPEKIPFRLTRMLCAAMEVSGTEGNFRTTCESVMSVLRQHRESVMAVLEAFVYDPLINWRLLRPARESMHENPQEGGSAMNTEKIAIDEETISKRSIFKHTSSEDNMDGAAGEGEEEASEVLNSKALEVIHRVQSKLTGKDFETAEALPVHTQVKELINQATSRHNLCQCYIGWCPFW